MCHVVLLHVLEEELSAEQVVVRQSYIHPEAVKRDTEEVAFVGHLR